MLFSAAFSLSSAQFLEHIYTPAEWIVVACVLVELVEGSEFLVGNDKVCIC